MKPHGPKPMAHGLLAIFLTILALCVSCSEPSRPAPGSDPGPGQVRYILGWDTGRVMDAEGGWVVETDLGYLVEVSGAYLVSFSMEIVECVPDPSILGAIWSLLDPVATAWAGHPGDGLNPAAIASSRVEDMVSLETTVAGMTEPGADRYCRAHYLVARADALTEGLPEDVVLEGRSLFLEGVWSRGGERRAFVIETSLAAGMLHEIYPPGGFGQEGLAFEADTGSGGVEVRITRDPAAFFDGVDFETMSERDMARQALRNLIAATIIEVSSSKGGM